MTRFLRVAVLLLPFPVVPAVQPGHDQELFRRIFGEQLLRFDPEAVARVKAIKEGEQVRLDTNGDGKPDTFYFIDPDPLHDDKLRPVLVKVVDRDGDLKADKDNDLYVADLRGDGTVDSVVEYIDRDRDGKLDEMGIYTYSAKNRNLGTDAIQVWWSQDIGHDHKLWETVNYRYQQDECQFRSHFNGDEIFSNYVFDAANGKWVPGWENPFAFYDEDGDTLSEAVIRFSGTGDQIESMRYSFDADNDTAEGNPHNYDFGFTCVASRKDGDGSRIPLPDALTFRARLRGSEAGPVLAWKNARSFGEHAPWGRVLMTWVENDNNVDSRPNHDSRDRWEGVIASPTEHFPQVGGPPVGPYNSRYEADLDNSGGMKLYRSAVDKRIHLVGADEGWLKADYDFDGTVDLEIRYEDTDRDGFVDTWSYDLDGDGKADRRVHNVRKGQPVPLRHASLVTTYRGLLADALTSNEAVIAAMKRVLQQRESGFREDEIEVYYRDRLKLYRESEGVGVRIHNSREGKRLYGDLIRERYYARLQKALEPALLRDVERFYDAGDYAAAARRLSAAKIPQ